MAQLKPIFVGPPLSQQLSTRRSQAMSSVEGIPRPQFIISSDGEILAHIIGRFGEPPIVLDEHSATMRNEEVRIYKKDADPISDSIDQTVAGTKMEIEFPFSGNAWVFNYTPDEGPSRVSRATAEDGIIRLYIVRPYDYPQDSMKTEYENSIENIRLQVKNSNRQIEEYNSRLEVDLTQAIAARREGIARHANLAELLNIPLAPRPDAPAIEPVRLEVRHPPALPIPPREGVRPEPGIRAEDFELILSFIRHQGRTYERTPATYAKLGEEDLRV